MILLEGKYQCFVSFRMETPGNIAFPKVSERAHDAPTYQGLPALPTFDLSNVVSQSLTRSIPWKMAHDLRPSAFNSNQDDILFEESIVVAYLPHLLKYLTPKTIRGSFRVFRIPSRFVIRLLLYLGSWSFIFHRFTSAIWIFCP